VERFSRGPEGSGGLDDGLLVSTLGCLYDPLCRGNRCSGWCRWTGWWSSLPSVQREAGSDAALHCSRRSSLKESLAIIPRGHRSPAPPARQLDQGGAAYPTDDLDPAARKGRQERRHDHWRGSGETTAPERRRGYTVGEGAGAVLQGCRGGQGTGRWIDRQHAGLSVRPSLSWRPLLVVLPLDRWGNGSSGSNGGAEVGRWIA
jgi:hypothetical protein